MVHERLHQIDNIHPPLTEKPSGHPGCDYLVKKIIGQKMASNTFIKQTISGTTGNCIFNNIIQIIQLLLHTNPTY